MGNLTLGAVVDVVGISCLSIHYHFKTKARLAEEVLEDYARANLDQSRTIWLDPKVTGHIPEFGGHDAETVGRDGPKYALSRKTLAGPDAGTS